MSLESQALRSLFEMSRDAVLGIENEKILFLNPAAVSLLGAAPGEDAAKYVPDYILADPADRFIASIRLGSRAGHVAVTRSGGFSLLCFTITPEENLSTPLLNRAMRDFSDALMSARLAIDILVKKTGAEEDPGLLGYSAALYRDYYRMKRLCEHITTADALERETLLFKPELTFLDRLFHELCSTVDHFAPALNITLEFQVEDADYATMADPALLESMLLNLLSNSIAHTSPGSRIRISLSRRRERFILAVNDQGSGISPESMSPILDGTTPLNTTDVTAGAGLGLGISRGIAELHGGALIMESRPGEGTKLRISLPVVPPSGDLLRSPAVPYRNDGMDRVLTEFSVILDKKFYNKTMFD